ncbi:MAG: COX15/CtaA family protein [Gemmatimonadales bacterium]|nr:COX15/CtaA family protein [Gemmatimonadales bacterium]
MTAPQAYHRSLHRYALAVAGATFVLVVAGGLVTSTGSGLSVPDWPLSFGTLFPRMEGGVRFEHTHRLIAATVGLLTIGLAVWIARREPRRWVRGLAFVAVGAVVIQSVLGGLTVLFKLPTPISVAHASLAEVFFAMTVALALVTSPRWLTPPDERPDSGSPSTRTLALATATAVYAQVLLGALVRHTGAALVIPDFPLAFGRLIPPVTSSLVAYQLAHRAGAVIVTLLVAWTAASVLGRHGDQPLLRRPALALVALLGFQILLGALTIWTRKAVTPTTAHVATGALLLITSVILALRAQLLLTPAAGAGALVPAGATR